MHISNDTNDFRNKKYLDEMQKTLTRAVDNCKMIVIGHAGQCDLYNCRSQF